MRLCIIIIIIIIMEICKAPTLQLKALNKHAHIMYIEMEMLSRKRERYRQGFKHNYAKRCTHTRTHACTHACTHAHTYTHTVQTDRSEGQCGLTEIF